MQKSNSRRAMMTIGGCLLVILLALLLPRQQNKPVVGNASPDSRNPITTESTEARPNKRAFQRSTASITAPAPTAEEIVARKVVQFGKNRRELVHAIAKRFNVTVPDDVEQFFDAVEGGRWEEIDAAHNALLAPGQGFNQPRSAELHQIWRGIQETWGAAREAHTWPAQKLLDYGESVLGSLRPGTIYVGGTDPGCFIPTFLNETSEGEPRITLTQNALADSTYLDYLNFRYADRLATLTQDDSKRLFDEYVADARKRFEHDQQFPDEPKRVLAGENTKIVDGKFQVTGQVAVMAINEKLFQLLLEKNPNASFAIEQSFPFKSTYADATPVGPIMELRVRDEQNALTRERAAQSVDYWRTTAQQLSSGTDSDSLYPRFAYAKAAAEQAGLLLDRGYAAEAEQALRLANEIGPGSPEAFYRLANLLSGQGRIADAIAAAEAIYGNLPSADRMRTYYGDNPTPAAQMRNVIEELKRTQKAKAQQR
jgi:tetratricopeptide (TPR) repeat protein